MRLLDARPIAQPDAQQAGAGGRRIDQQQWSGRQLGWYRTHQHGQIRRVVLTSFGGHRAGRAHVQGRNGLERALQAVGGAAEHEHVARRPARRRCVENVVQPERVVAEEAHRDVPGVDGQRNAQPRPRSRGDVDLPLVEGRAVGGQPQRDARGMVGLVGKLDKCRLAATIGVQANVERGDCLVFRAAPDGDDFDWRRQRADRIERAARRRR